MNLCALEKMTCDFKPLFDELFSVQIQIREKLREYADGKYLKGHELVGWLGEIYVKLLLDGRLVADNHEHDVETRDLRRISAKARRGKGSGWQQTSPIPTIEGESCPTHLAFVHMHEDYSLDRIWLFEWQRLCQCNRFKLHSVRGQIRSYIFKLNEKLDRQYVVYDSSIDKPV